MLLTTNLQCHHVNLIHFLWKNHNLAKCRVTSKDQNRSDANGLQQTYVEFSMTDFSSTVGLDVIERSNKSSFVLFIVIEVEFNDAFSSLKAEH